MIYKKLLISCAVSTFLCAANNADKEYQVNFSSGGGSTDKAPTFSSSEAFTENEQFSWNRRDGIFIIQSPFPTEPSILPTVTATFKSDTNNYGILTLKSFSYINAPSKGDSSEGGLKAPTKEDADAKKLLSSKLVIANDSSSGFKGFVLSGNGSGEGVNLYSGAHLAIEGFTQTILNGTVNINAGGISKDSNSYGYLNSSLSIASDKDYSTLAIKSSLNLNTNNGNPRTELRPEARFEADVKGNISIEGYTTVANQAIANFKAGNLLKVSSTLSVSAQEMKKITKDGLGNESVLDIDRVKQKNLTLSAPKIELSGGIDLGLNAQEIKTEEEVVDGVKIVKIRQHPSDIGVIAKITADIDDKKISNGGTKPTDWNEVKKAQFIQTSGGRIGIGMNSEAKITTINNVSNNSEKIFDDKDPYAITFSNVTVQNQKAGNKILNLDARVELRKSQESGKKSIEVSEGAGKVLFQGSFDLGKNANAKIEAYDGFDLHKDSRFILAKDSLIWLRSKKSDFSLTNEGNIQAKGGAFLAGDVYKGNGQINIALKNMGTILISDSKRSTQEEGPSHPNPPIPREGEKPLRELDPSGVFLLGQKNVLDNQGSLIFDGFGNLTTMVSREDRIIRGLEIINSSGKKGVINVRGSQNTIVSGGSIKIASQDISIASKTVEEGEGENKKNVTYQGEIILRSTSKDASNKIVLGNEKPSSGRDRVSVTGGTLRIESFGAGVDSYNLRLVDTTLDLTKLSSYQKDGMMIGGGGAFVNQRRLELGGNVTIHVSSESGAFANGEYQGRIEDFKDNLPTIKIQGDNAIFVPKDKAENAQGKFGFDNNANLELYSNAKFKVGGDFNNNGTVIFKADQFGAGTISVEGDLVFDMTNHQGGDKTVNPLVAVTHSNFYSLSLDHPYILFQSKQIKYRVGSLVIDSSDGGDTSPKPRADEMKDTLTYAKQQEYLKKEIEDFLNGVNAYEGNEDKLGIFLRGVGLVSGNSVGFILTRSDAIAQIQSNSSLTGVIDQYFDILTKSDGQVSNNKTNTMKAQLSASNPMALKVLNNALESKNSLELGILKDIGSYNTFGLIQTAHAINQSMKTMANVEKPLIEDFQKMQIVREVAVQNRMMRFSNPYVAEIELAQYIKNLSSNRYVQGEIQNDISPSLPSYAPEGSDKDSYKHSFWGSAISSTTKEKGSTSALYGFSVGYEYVPIANVLIGAYFAYGYSDFKESILRNNAHNVDLTVYTRLYYENSEVDLTLGYIQAFNNMKIENPNSSLSQKLDFGSNAFDFSIKYGYIFKIPKVKGLFIKPQGSYTIYGVNIPDLKGSSSASIMYDKQLRGGMIFNLGAEVRQYISAYSFLYVLPSFEYNLMNKEEGSVYFVGATNKLHYSSNGQAKGLFSLYAGGEGYISPDFSLNLSAGYKAGLDKEEHNISISAGFRYKF